MKPFVKWTGGKTRLLPVLNEVIPEGPVVEVFVGGGALFWDRADQGHIAPVLNDGSWPLINAMRAVRADPGRVADELERIERSYNADEPLAWRAVYLDIRARFNAKRRHGTKIAYKQAARFIWLTRAAFSGLWRVNRKGEHNVPPADYKFIKLPDYSELYLRQIYLRQVKLMHGDFAQVSGRVARHPLYCDPPYVPVKKGGFVSYSGAFDSDDQARVARFAAEWPNTAFVSNHKLPFTVELYKEHGGEIVWEGLVPRTGGRGVREPVIEAIWRF